MKPTTKLLLCDFFFDKKGLNQKEMGANFKIVKSRNITENVCEALRRMDRSLEEAEISNHVNFFLKDWGKEQFGLPGSWINKRMLKKDKEGNYKMSYWAYEIMLDETYEKPIPGDVHVKTELKEGFESSELKMD